MLEIDSIWLVLRDSYTSFSGSAGVLCEHVRASSLNHSADSLLFTVEAYFTSSLVIAQRKPPSGATYEDFQCRLGDINPNKPLR